MYIYIIICILYIMTTCATKNKHVQCFLWPSSVLACGAGTWRRGGSQSTLPGKSDERGVSTNSGKRIGKIKKQRIPLHWLPRFLTERKILTERKLTTQTRSLLALQLVTYSSGSVAPGQSRTKHRLHVSQSIKIALFNLYEIVV